MPLKDSNLYAEKIYADYPLGLWTFDDNISYIQLLSGDQLNLSSSAWLTKNLKYDESVKYNYTPISNSPQSRFSSLFGGSNGKFVSVGTDNVSGDLFDNFLSFGETNSQKIFSEDTSLTSGALVSIIFDGEKFISLRSFTGDIYYSYDAETWETSNLNHPTSKPWWSLFHNNGTYIASGGGTIRLSDDGINWPSASAYNFGDGAYYYETISFGNSKYVGTGYHWNGGPTNAVVSTDGKTWTEYALPTSTTNVTATVAYGDGKFVILLEGTDEGYYSTDGQNWNQCTIPAGTKIPGFGKIVYGNGIFISIGAGSDYLTSSDGINWTVRNLGINKNFEKTISFIEKENKFYGISSYNGDRNIFSSTDGISWEVEPVQDNFSTSFKYSSLAINELTLQDEISESLTSEIYSNFTINTSQFSQNKATACFSCHIYQADIFTSYYEIGIRYDNEEEFQKFTFGSYIGWQKISHTFDIPDNKDISFFIRVKFENNAVASNSNFVFQNNGTSLGQWSEQYNDTSLGFNDIPLPSEISKIISSSSSYTCAIADAYGVDDGNNAYYLINNGEISVRNSGIPLVFGSKNSTKVFDAKNNNPSVLIPGQGFLNNSGKYNAYTLEMWMRIKNESTEKIKILGPVFSSDGIYVEDGYIYFVIGGKYSKYYYVGKWYRPMLLHLKYSQNNVYLYINGAEVIAQEISVSNLSFPEKESGGVNQDWIGIYGNYSVNPFEIDCLSIFPYSLPIDVAKKRFVYGQGVQAVEKITQYYTSQKTFFDYSNSEYASNLIYPDIVPWDKSSFSVNTNSNSYFISVPDYELPEFLVSDENISYKDWIDANSIENTNYPETYKYFRILPESIRDSNSLTASLNFESIDIVDENIKSIVGVFNADTSSEEYQPLMIFKNNATEESLKIIIEPDALDENVFILKYIYIDYNGSETIINQQNISKSEYFVAGIDIEQLQSSNSSLIGNFLSSMSNISLTIGKETTKTFLGKVYSIHFIGDFLFQKENYQYFNNGISLQQNDSFNVYEHFIEYTANYSLIPLFENSIFSIDIGCKSYWEDIKPLSYFGKYIFDNNGNKYYDLDLIQFNIDTTKINNSFINSYITFRDYSNANKKLYSEYVNSVSVSQNKVVEFDPESYNDTKYQVVDSSIIIPPKNNFINYFIGIHLEFEVRGIINKNFNIKRMEISSNSFNDTAPTKIGTRFSEPVYPFVRDLALFKYKETNPITIYKDSSEILYLTDNSGMYVNEYPSSFDRGFFIPVNKNKNEEYNLGSIDFWSWFPDNEFQLVNKKIFSIISNEKYFDVYMYPESDGKRSLLKIINRDSGLEEKNINYFQDGEKVINPIIYPRRWSAISINFLQPIKFNNYTGRIEFYSGLLYNNITKYIYSVDIVNSYISSYNKWFQVLYNEETSSESSWYNWSRLEGTSVYGSWSDQTQQIESNEYSVNSKDIYNSQVGISTIVADDNSRLSIYSNGADVLTEVSWQKIEKTVI